MSIESRKRSVVKAVTYRILIIVLDFVMVYWLTRQAKIALGFMVASNVYTTVAYFLHERAWTRVRWGLVAPPTSPPAKPA